MENYNFDTIMSKEVMENYLKKSVTAADIVDSETLDDDIRALIRIGAKFIGRATSMWKPHDTDEVHFAKTKKFAELIHEKDQDIIIQSCIFEMVYTLINKIEIPSWVFESFQLPVEKRNFNFENIIFLEKPKSYLDENRCGIPDITRIETKMWFYYRAVMYINCGVEALHMGQIHLYTANDTDFSQTFELFSKIREYAKKNARRHKVLMDAHTHGVNVNGNLLFDYHAMPFSRMPILDVKGEKLSLVMEGFSEGGKNINGFEADSMPYLMEYDNWGGKFFDEKDNIPYEKRAFMDWWGYDQISWFSNQDEENRNKFLEYTFKWTAINNINGYFQVPFRRMLSNNLIEMENFKTGKKELQGCYQANNKSEGCPLGFSQEDTIKKLWDNYQVFNNLRENAVKPSQILDFGAKDEYDQITGIKLPSKVVVYGSFQHHVGAINNDSNSETTRMYYTFNNTYELDIILPFAGEYDFAISTYGTLSSTFSFDRFPRSGSSNKRTFKIEEDNTVVKFIYKFIENSVDIKMFK